MDNKKEFVQRVLQNKVFLVEALSVEVDFILQHVHQAKLVTQRDYQNLSDVQQRERKVIALLDKLMGRGEETCHQFVDLLQQQEIQDVVPVLKSHDMFASSALQEEPMLQALPVESRQGSVYHLMVHVLGILLILPVYLTLDGILFYRGESELSSARFIRGNTCDLSTPYRFCEMFTLPECLPLLFQIQYSITQNPRGTCVIINNVHFEALKERMGSDEDQNYLRKVFSWLGFEVVVFRDQTAPEMGDTLNELAKTVKGDCFVCCVLSHGKKEGVCGTDGSVISVDEIREPFSGMNCSSLVGKPKLFFIQACRGSKNQFRVRIQAAGPDDESDTEADDDGFEVTIPSDSDFLIARSTTEGHYSYRKPDEGSWFIQSLCRNLEKYCPVGEDMQTILLHVNNDVSRQGLFNKQMPIYEVAMRKKLILTPVNF